MKIARIFIIMIGIFSMSIFPAYAEFQMAPYYYLETSESFFTENNVPAWSTDISGDFAAKMIFNEKWSLIPLYEMSYVGPGAGAGNKGGANFQEQYQNHSVIGKVLYSLNDNWKLGGKIGYQMQLSKTGSNEQWASGMYNYSGITCGIDGTTKIMGFNINSGYLMAQNIYPNATSLFNIYDPTQGAQEYDYYRHKLFINAALPIKPFNVDSSFSYNIKSYVAAGVIQASGVKDTNIKRLDNVLNLAVNADYTTPLKGLAVSLNQNMELNYSNQSVLVTDYSNTLGIPIVGSNYYSYSFYEVQPKITYAFPNNIVFNIYYKFNIMNYQSRPPQSQTGIMLTGTEWDVVREGGAGFSFPMGKFNLGLNYIYLSALSNMKYEQYYQYNYSVNTVKLTYSFEY